MLQAGVRVARPRNGRAIAVAATLLSAVALGQANLAYAGPHVGGSFHGGGFGGFHDRFAGVHRGFRERHDVSSAA